MKECRYVTGAVQMGSSGRARRLGQEEPREVGLCKRHVGLLVDRKRWRNVERDDLFDFIHMILRKPRSDPGAAIVTNDAEPAKAQGAHHPDLVLRHWPPGIVPVVRQSAELAIVSIPAQVGSDDGKALDQLASHLVPNGMRLGMAM